jgi:hypothetical protein
VPAHADVPTISRKSYNLGYLAAMRIRSASTPELHAQDLLFGAGVRIFYNEHYELLADAIRR